MSRFLKFTLVAGLTVSATATVVWSGEYGLGRAALPEEIAAWDVNIMPDGRGLPEGSGDVWTGEEVFIENCAFCHGDFAEGAGNWPQLAGGEGTLADDDPVKTTGSYWPYLSTVWDYVNRSMPYGNAQSLSPDDVYAITAYILYSNFLVDDDFVLSNENFAEFEMPNADGFIVDDRAETEYAIWHGEPCMENCKDERRDHHARRRARRDPRGGGGRGREAACSPGTRGATGRGGRRRAGAGTRRRRARSRTCRRRRKGVPPVQGLPPGGRGGQEPRRAAAQRRGEPRRRGGGRVQVFLRAGRSMAADGLTWDAESLSAFLADPRGYMKGTKMGFAGLRSDEDIEAVTAYLMSFEE